METSAPVRRRGTKHMLWRDIRRTVGRSRGRFVSIVLLMALGSFALVGLKAAGPDMRATGERYFDTYNAADLTVIASMGIDDDDEAAIDQASGVEQVEYGYLKDMVISGTIDAVRVYSQPEEISRVEVASGRLPRSVDEIAVSPTVAEEHSVGSVIAFDEEPDISGADALVRHEFTVVGVINSPEVISKVNMGQTQTGTGNLFGLAVVAPDAFSVDYHMIARLRFSDTMGLDPYSQEYLDRVAAHKEELEELLANQPQHRYETVASSFDESIASGQQQLDEARSTLSDTADELARAASELEEGRAQIAAAQQEVDAAPAQLAAGRDALDASWEILTASAPELAQAREQLAQGKDTLERSARELQAARDELARQQAAYDEAVAPVDEAQAQIDASRSQLNEGLSRFEGAVASAQQAVDGLAVQVAAAKERLDEIDRQLAALDPADASYDEARQELEGQRDACAAQLDELEQSQAQAQEALDAALAARESFLSVDATPGDGVDDGGYTACLAALDAKQEQVDALRAQLQPAKDELAAAAALIDEAQGRYDAGAAAYEQALGAYQVNAASYEEGLAAWQAGVQELAAKTGAYEQARAQLAQARELLAQNEQTYEDGRAAYEEALPAAQQTIDDAEADLAAARDARDSLEVPTYAVYNRREIPGAEGYTIYATISEIVDSLANIFPFFLYFVAALVTFTTMTRMVDEERVGAGTLKALGYDDADVMKKFAFYGGVAGLVGTVIGIVAGHTLLPLIVWAAYAHAYTLPVIELHIHPGVTVLALAFAFIAAVLPAMVAAKHEVREKPASLLLPKAPAAGSTILLERIPLIWRRLSFTHKVTARNLFRYKRRALMTIVGVAGAASLLFCGFAVQHSISGIGDRQFGELIGYDLIVAERGHVTDAEDAQVQDALADDAVADSSAIRYESLTKVAGSKGDTQSITLLVPRDVEAFTQYLTIQNRVTGERLDLPASGAVISERLATLTGTDVGDLFTFVDGDGVERSVRIVGICEMYVTHFMFMSADAYREVFGQEPSPNAYVATLADGSIENTEVQAARFMELPGVAGVVQNTMYINQVNIIVRSLNMIMTVLIGIASGLAVVILYNLVTINVSERIRELSTIKVLGFRPREVTMYIYRETILLSIIGVPLGWALGRLLQLYIITAVPPEETMFNPACGVLAFVVPTLVIAAVVALLYLAVDRRLRRVDMLEALKSVD
ncbi:FtsX-like permease family protein [Collinsella sp. An2]|uniref:FtsX-like permease family protein n=1 Tax=Collinsella sp. An2 TaxID=1965585 RepID=UPI000B38C34A|nr:FtsX-like permease family protein [Collinsella sp. An2]OUP08430.1 hypothetical protein B5F33_06930 [Collinsella sp. An2]